MGNLDRFIVPDPWPTRLRALWNRTVVCTLRGHDTLTKMDGTVLCRRH